MKKSYGRKKKSFLQYVYFRKKKIHIQDTKRYYEDTCGKKLALYITNPPTH